MWLVEMYLAIPGQDVPSHSWLGCGYDAVNMCLGRDVPGHSWPRCGCDAANMCLGRDVPGHSWTGYTQPFRDGMYLAIPGWDVVGLLPY